MKKTTQNGMRGVLESLENRIVPTKPFPLPVIYVGADTGNTSLIRGFDAESGSVTIDRQVFEDGFTGGVRVGIADLTNDTYPDLIVGAGAGGGPRVRVLDGKTGEPIAGPLGDFFAFDSNFRGGVAVAAGDVTGDNIPDVIVTAGLGGGPHVRVFNGRDGSLWSEFFAVEPDFRGGLSVAVADFTGDGQSEIAIGAGIGGAPRVRVLDAKTGTSILGALGDFYAFDPSTRGGINVGTDTIAGDVTADGRSDLIVGAGSEQSPEVIVFNGATGRIASRFQAFSDDVRGGVRVATAYITDDAHADIVTSPASGGNLHVYDGASGSMLSSPIGNFSPFGLGVTGGANIAASNDPPVVIGNHTYTSEQGKIVEVTVTLDQDALEYPDLYLWNYEVRNIDFDAPLYDEQRGLEKFGLYFQTPTTVTNINNSAGWSSDLIQIDEEHKYLEWRGGLMAPSTTENFWFTTRPVTVGSAEIFLESPSEERDFAGGYCNAPAEEILVDIDVDSDRDYSIDLENTSNDDKWEESIGVIVIADKDSVYAADSMFNENDTARRRKLEVNTADPNVKKVTIFRSKDNVRLFKQEETIGDEDPEIVFNNANEAEVDSNGIYWIQGGSKASTNNQETKLKAKPKGAPNFVDIVSVTVLWVAQSGHTDPADKISGGAIYDKLDKLSDFYGLTNRGLQASTNDKTLNRLHGVIEIQGKLSPSNIDEFAKADPRPAFVNGMTVGLETSEPNSIGQPRSRATAAYGFTFHRDVDIKRYNNGIQDYLGNGGPYEFKGYDDSFSGSQDVDPDDSLIVDVDGPTISVLRQPNAKVADYSGHVRGNFKEWVTFHLYPTLTPYRERCSERVDWSFKADIAANTNGKWSYIYDKANNGTKTNEVLYGPNSALSSLDITVPVATITEAIVVGAAMGDEKKLPATGAFTVRITGTNLVGQVILKSADGNEIFSQMVRVKESSAADRYSDLTEIEAAFPGPVPLGNYTLRILNAGGTVIGPVFNQPL